MCRKKHLKLYFERSFINLKSLKRIFFIPILFSGVVLPAMLAVSLKKYGAGEKFLVDTKSYCLMILPAAVSFWSIFSMKNYVGEIGAEVLYVCRNRIKIFDFAVLLFYGMINMCIPFAFTCIITKEAVPIFIAVICVSVFLVGISFFLLYSTKSLTTVIMTDLLYVMGSITLGGYYTFFPFYVTADAITYLTVAEFYLPIFSLGIVFFILGVKRNRCSCI